MSATEHDDPGSTPADPSRSSATPRTPRAVARWWQPVWWLPEKRRSLTSAAVAILGGPAVIAFSARRPRLGDLPGSLSDSVALVFTCYLIAYVLLTAWNFGRALPEQVLAWARGTRRGSRFERWVYATDPGAGVATTVAFVALAAALDGETARFWGKDMAESWGLAATVVLIVLAWVSVLLTFSIDYLCRDQRERGTHLDFPGGVHRWSDYLYFSMAVMTTFGATDVTVATSAMRRNVTVHGVIAFVFNTVILALVLGLFS